MDRTSVGTSAPLLGEALPVELMNTIWADRDGVHDALATADLAIAWLRAVQDRLTPQQPTVTSWVHEPRPDELDHAVKGLQQLRDALRRLAAEATSDARPAARSATRDRTEALEILGHLCATAPTWSSLQWTDGHAPRRRIHSNGSPGQILVSSLAEQAVELFTGEQAGQLRACLAPGCVLYFMKEHPRREWCSATCGNRARVARHYRRHRAESFRTT